MAITGRGNATEGVSRAGAASVASEERSLYQDLVDAQPGGVYRLRVRLAEIPTVEMWRDAVDASYSVDFVSERFAEILGITRAEFQRNAGIIPDLVVEEDRPGFSQRNVEAVANLTPFRWEGRVKVRGETRWVRLESLPRRLANGDVVWTGVVEDITERKRAEEEIRRMALMADTAPNSITVHDFDGRFYYANQKTFELHGYSPEEFMALNLRELDVPADAERIAARMQELRERGRASFEVEHFRKDGTVLPMEISIKATTWGGKEALLSVATDLTDRKRAEEALKVKEAAIASSINGISINDLAGRVTYGNDAFVRMWGYDTANEIIGMRIPDFVKDPSNVAPIMEALTTRGHWVGERLAKRKDGSTFHVQLVTNRVDDENGRPICLLASFLDVSERKRAEEAIGQLNAELEQHVKERTAELEAANRGLDSFSYSVSHVLRVPLRAVEGFSAIMERDHSGHLDAEGHRLLGVVRTNALRMSRLIDDLLSFSRTGRSKLRRTRLAMKAMVQDVFDEVAADPVARAKIDFRLGELPEAEGDAPLLRQVWINLLSNAVKFSARVEQPVIEVDGAVEGDLVVYRVRDNGAGFDMAYAHKLFSVFQRLHGPTEFEGTGIGLALVQQIVTRHGGRVWGEGAVGKGATFSFSLPVKARSDLSMSWKKLVLPPGTTNSP